jgi:peptide/nickel transport system substrate-binding protein
MPVRPPRLFALAVAAALVLCAAPATAQSHLRIGLQEDPDILDPTFARTFVGRIVFSALCDKLFDIDDKLAIVPQLATGHQVAADGRSMTITLRTGVRFHDGEPMDAAAVKFSLDRHLTAQGSFRRAEISSIKEVTVVDPGTVRLELQQPFAPLLAQLTDRAGMILSPKAVQAAGANFGSRPICAGPFKFVERVAQDRIVVERFADYWDAARIHLDRVTFLPIPDQTVRLANLQAGSLALIERVLPTDLATIRRNSRLRVVSQDELGYQGITMNVANGPRADTPFGRDPRVRQAFELAIDRQIINQVVYSGEFLVGNQWVSPVSPFYQRSMPVPGRDVARARALLKDAGVGTPVSLTLMVPNNPEFRQVGEVIQSMVREAGFDVKLQATEFATLLTTAEKGDFDATLLGWSGRTDPDGNLHSFVSCRGPLNYGKFCDQAIDTLIERSRQTSDVAERMRLFEQVAQKTLREGPVMYLFHRKWLYAHDQRVTGFRAVPDGLIRLQDVKLN